MKEEIRMETPQATELLGAYSPTLKLEEVEKMWIELAVKHHNGNIAAAAHTLGISRSTLYRKVKDVSDLRQRSKKS